ncbi:hypothetical protein P5V15_008386 [Pogonomyrmex californicus]
MDELQALLDINSAQTEKELAEQLGVTQQIISIRLHTMEKVQKEGKWVPHELSEDNKNRRRDTALTLLSGSGKKIFCKKSLQAMKSGFFMITLNVENHGLTLVNLRYRAKAQYPRQEGFALYLVGLERCVVLRVVTIG